MRALCTLTLPVFLGAAQLGCGGLSHTVSRAQLQNISIENKLLLFDAENDVSIAIDEREQIQREIREARQDLEDANGQRRQAKEDGSRAKGKRDDNAVQVATLAFEVFGLKTAYIESQVRALRRRLEAQDSMIDVAWAKFELAKAKLVKKNNVRGATDLKVEKFEAQVDKYVARARQERQRVTDMEQDAEQLKALWLERRAALQQASGGGAGSAWAEDFSLWGSY